jgi:hypothetical protein
MRITLNAVPLFLAVALIFQTRLPSCSTTMDVSLLATRIANTLIARCYFVLFFVRSEAVFPCVLRLGESWGNGGSHEHHHERG